MWKNPWLRPRIFFALKPIESMRAASMQSFFRGLWLVLTLTGCAALDASPFWQSLRQLVPPPAVPEKTDFPPPYRYLRLEIDGRVIFLASDTPQADAPGVDVTWYSAGREVLRLRDGRLVAAIGMREEWRAVSLPVLPEWTTLVDRDVPLRWVRKRDVMPGYRFGVEDALVLQKVAPPQGSALKGYAPAALVWFEERFEHAEAPGALPVARYAVQREGGSAQVVYGEQCLARTLCFSWQRWPLEGAVR